jgi:hypothetical protein
MSEASMFRRQILSIIVLTMTLSATAIGQKSDSTKSEQPFFNNVPNMFLAQLNALGSRGKVIGKERTVYAGQFFDGDGKSKSARVTQELSGLVKLEGFKGSSGSLSFDGQSARGMTSSRQDYALLEVFLSDSIEGVLAAIQENSAVRLIGKNFPAGPNDSPDYKGQTYDIYQVATKLAFRNDQITRIKKYYFDSKTQHLCMVRYTDETVNPPIAVETHYSIWGEIDGSVFPAEVDHFENGKSVFSFIAETITNDKSIGEAGY